MATQVTRWVSQDGKLWDTIQEAERHEETQQLLAIINRDLSSRDLDSDEILTWIGQNITMLKEYFNA